MRHIAPISGKDSLATYLVQKELAPDLPYELMFNPTGAETPEVDDWLAKVERYTGLKIERVGDNLEDIIAEQGILPSPRVRYCTRMAKIQPMEDWIGNVPATVYYGIRADEQRAGYSSLSHKNIIPSYPLQQVGMGIDGVWQLLEDRDLLPPLFFWQELYDLVIERLGSDRWLVDELDHISFHRLFAWRSRANCHFCFFQRQYEWVGLLRHHPDLFWRDVEIEETTGASGYTWRQDMSLRQIAAKADQIIDKRANSIRGLLLKSTQQRLPVFEEAESEVPDLLQVVSCGLFCGK